VSTRLDALTDELRRIAPHEQEPLFEELTQDYTFTTQLYQKLQTAYAARERTRPPFNPLRA
jgi:hypothetical protein